MNKSSAGVRRKSTPNILLIGIGFGLFYWFIDAAIESLLFKDGSIWRSVISPSSEQIWMRVFILFLLALFSLAVQAILNKRRDAERALEESEDRYKRMAAMTSEGIVIHNGERILDANQAAARIFGYEPSEMIGSPTAKFLSEESHADAMEKMRKSYEKPYPVVGVRKDGQHIRLEVVGRKAVWRGQDVRVVAARPVTEQKEHAAAPADTGTKYRILFNNNNDPLFVFQLDENGDAGPFIEANEIACKLFDCTRETLMERSPLEFIAPEEAESFKQIVQNLIDFKYSLFETEIINRVNRRIPLEVSAHLFELDGIRTIIGSARDLSERRKAEATIRERERRYRTLYENSPVVYVALEEDGTIEEVSERWLELTGYKREEVVGHLLTDFLSEESSRYFGKLFIKARTAQGLHNVEITLKKKDSEAVTISLEGSIERDDLGGFQRAHCIFSDISVLEEAKAGMAGYESGLAHIFENVSEIIFTLDPYGSFLSVNSEFEKATGFARHEIIAKDISDYVHPDDREFVKQAFGKCGKGESIPTMEIRLRKSDGEHLCLEFVSAPLEHEGQTVAVQAISRLSPPEGTGESEPVREHTYRKIINSMLDAVLILDREANIVLSNNVYEEWAEKLGVPILKVGQSPLEHYEFLASEKENFRKIMETGEAIISDEIFQIGEIQVHFEMHRIPIFEGDELSGVMVVVRDIAARKMAESGLKEAADKFRMMFEKEDIAFIEVGADERIISANQGTSAILHHEAKEIVGKPLSEVIGVCLDESGKEVDPSENRIFKALREHRASANVVLGLKTNKGIIRVNASLIPLYSEQPDGSHTTIISFSDFSDWWESRRVAEVQRDLGMALIETSDFNDYLKACAEAATEISNTHSCGIYLINESTGALELQYHQGLSKDFARLVSHYEPGMPETILVQKGEPVFTSFKELKFPVSKHALKEGLRAIAIIPCKYENRIIGSLHISSRTADDIPDESQRALEMIGTQISVALARARAEAGLIESETRVRQIAENIKEVFWLMNFDASQLLYISPAYKTIWGRDPQELYDDPSTRYDYIFEEDLTSVKQASARLSSGDYDIEYRIVLPDGGIRWIHDRAFPIRDSYGEIYRVAGFASDVTDRKDIELALRNERDFSESIIKTAQAIILVLDTSGNIISLNPYAEELTRYKQEEVFGKNWFEIFIPEENRESLKKLFGATLDDIKITRMENVLKNRDGKLFEIEWHNKSLKKDSGEIIGVLSIGIDVTAQNQAARTTRDGEMRFHNLFNNMSVGAAVFFWSNEHEDFVFRDINQVGEAIFKVQGRKIIGKPFGEIISAEGGDALHQILKDIKDEDGPIIRSTTFKRKGQPVQWLENFCYRLQTGEYVLTFDDVTERKLAEVRLKYQAELLENVSDAILSTDMDLRIKSWNRAAERIYGWPRNEVLGKRIKETVPIQMSDREIEEKLKRLLADGYWKGEIEQVDREGNILTIQLSGALLSDRDGNPRGIVAVCRDLTSHKQAEEKIRKSDEHIKAMFDSASVGVGVLDRDGNWLQANNFLCEMLGYGLDEICSMSTFEVTAAEDHDKTRKMLRDIFTGDIQNYRYEKRYLSKGGKTIWASLSISPIHDKDGKVEAILGVVIDITDRKKYEEELIKAKEFLDNVIDALDDPLIVRDPDYRIVALNRSACELAGKSREEIVGQSSQYILPEKYCREAHEMDNQVFASGESRTDIIEMDIDSGPRTLAAKRSLFTDSVSGKRFVTITLSDITELRQQEERLRESEQRFRAIFEQAAVGIVVVDQKANWLQVNQKMCDMLGYPAEDIIGRNANEFTHPDDILEDKRAFGSILSSPDEDYIYREKRYISAAGETIWAAVYSRVIRDGNGNPHYFIGIIENITERKLAEEQLRESEERLRLAVQNIPVMAAAFDENLNIIVWNRECERVTGYAGEEILGNIRAFDKLYPEKEIREKVVEYWSNRNSADSSTKRDWETKLVCKDGSERIIAWSNASLEYSIPGWTSWGVGIDVTDRRLAEEALLESEERFRSIVESSVDGISLFDESGMVIEWNSGMEKITGMRREDAIGTPIWEIWHTLSLDENRSEERLEGLKLHALEILENPDSPFLNRFRDQEMITVDGKRRIVQYMPFPIKSDLGYKICTISRDLTENRMLEKEHFKSQKLESIGILAGGIAHDFNNILTAIIGNITLAKLEVSPENELHHRLTEAEKASERAQDLTRQLLTFSKGGAPVKKSASIAQIIEEASSFSLRGSNVKGKYNLPKDLYAVEVDAGQISQVFNNLIINAVQAMPDGGKIEVRAENVEVSEATSVPLRFGKYVVITMTDTGIGIKPEHIRKIFDPYFTTKKKGNGLGLATTYSIIKNHDGHISVDSVPGEGTTFTIYLPASISKPVEMRKADVIRVGGGGKILVMDDEEAIRKITGITLEKMGFKVEFAVDGSEAIVKYGMAIQQGEKFDAVIMDLTIPGGMGGKETIERLRELDPDLKAIVSSGYSNDPIMADYARYGFAGMVIKPYKATDLAAVVSEVVGGSKSSVPKP